MRIRTMSFASIVLLGSLAGSPAHAENLDILMSKLFPQQQPAYIGFDSVERNQVKVSASTNRKYLIVDFRFQLAPETEQLQASVHKICMALLRDRELIRSLSDSGYDMVSVAFDRQSQYHCL